MEKELGGKGKMPSAEFAACARQFAERYVEQHKRDSKRLGVFGDWAHPYRTMDTVTRPPSPVLPSWISWRRVTLIAARRPVYWWRTEDGFGHC